MRVFLLVPKCKMTNNNRKEAASKKEAGRTDAIDEKLFTWSYASLKFRFARRHSHRSSCNYRNSFSFQCVMTSSSCEIH